MEVNIKHFEDIVIPDNEEVYILKSIAIIESIDELSHIQITKISNGYSFRVAPSLPQYLLPILEELLNFNNSLGLRLNLSKSIKSSSVLNYEINFLEN